jgi:hypothetical protein
MTPSGREAQAPPPLPSPPSGRQLATTVVLSLGVAALLLVTVVLPAEYGLDPLRTGRALGLTRLSAPPAAADVAAPPAGAALLPTLDGPIGHYPDRFRTDTAQFILGPYEFVEYKYRLEKGAAMLYSWTGSATVIHDFHGEPQPAAENAAVSYEKKARSGAHGTFTAPFAGIHGWYWENPGADPITVTLTTAGFYSSAIEIRSDRTRRAHEVR